MTQNSNLHAAKKNKNDEFYTLLTDIEKELKHYRHHFKGKKIFLNCDDPRESNFWRYFSLNFDFLGLEKLTSTHYDADHPTYRLDMYRDDDGEIQTTQTDLEQNGDFRSPEAIEILKESDIVVTNPPFSLFREFIAQLMEYEKDFLVIGTINAVTYKEIFPLIKDNKLLPGYSFNKVLEFQVPEHYPLSGSRTRISDNGDKFINVPGIAWYTNLDISKRHEELILWKTYNEKDYPSYDNYDAIEVSKVKNIPVDYDEVMGVPITFLNKYNPAQFEILGMIKGSDAFGATRKIIYKNPIRHTDNKPSKKDNNLNAAPAIKIEDISDVKKYYTADNSDGYLISLYARILIKKKEETDGDRTESNQSE